jgi:hypothetical protein
MRRTKARLARLAVGVCLLCFGLAGSCGAEPAKGDASKKAAPAKGDGQITIADWLDVGGKVVDAANELFGNRRAPARVIAAPGGLPNLAQQFEKQYGPRFRQMYRSELHLMRMACQPSREQFDKISSAGEVDLKEIIKQCAGFWQQRQQAARAVGENWPEVRNLVAAGISKAGRTVLTADQAARYQQELKEREASRRRVVVRMLATAADCKLVLSAEQRAKLTEILDKNWQPWWSQHLVRGAGILVPLPDDEILPILSESQKAVWRVLQKANRWYGLELDWYETFDIGDEVWPVATGDKK